MKSNFDLLVSKLPEDIIHFIIPFTYNIQPKELCNDITNYIKNKNIIDKLYFNIYTNEDNEDRNWIYNDIFGEANGWQPLMFGYTDYFYSIIRRSYCKKNLTNLEIDALYDFTKELNLQEINQQIFILFALFTPEERDWFVSKTITRFTPFVISNDNSASLPTQNIT
jgi:hypothetical protein